MDNTYAALSSVGTWTKGNTEAILGLNYAYYDGHHYGLKTFDVINPIYASSGVLPQPWQETRRQRLPENYRYHTFERSGQHLKLFADVQYRYVSLQMGGTDTDGISMAHNTQWHFSTPKPA